LFLRKSKSSCLRFFFLNRVSCIGIKLTFGCFKSNRNYFVEEGNKKFILMIEAMTFNDVTFLKRANWWVYKFYIVKEHLYDYWVVLFDLNQ
jgi:hypothetical protein